MSAILYFLEKILPNFNLKIQGFSMEKMAQIRQISKAKSCLPAEHPEIMSRIQSCDFCASHKRDKNCAFARVLQNMQNNKMVLPAEHAES
jgi:hypothetical protein